MSNPFDELAGHAIREYEKGKTIRANEIAVNIACEVDTERVNDVIDRFARELGDCIKFTVEY